MNEHKKEWKALLSQLDIHEAPDQLNLEALKNKQDQDWVTLLNKLPAETAPEIKMEFQKETKIFNILPNIKNWLKIAASLLFIISIWMFWPLKNNDSSIVLTKQAAEQTNFDASNMEAAWSLDEFCAAYEIQCDQQELGQFREEWEEVSSAILLILESLENNQNDEFLLRQLSTLEARHAELVNELLKIVWS